MRTDERYQLYMYQVSGKSAKFQTTDHTKILKAYDKREYRFYQLINSTSHPPLALLARFTPKFYGARQIEINVDLLNPLQVKDTSLGEWLDHLMDRQPVKNTRRFMILQNMLSTYRYPNVLDVKVGDREKQSKRIKVVLQYLLKLNGLQKHPANGDQQFLSKYALNQISQSEDLKKSLAYFFQVDGIINPQLLDNIINQVKQLALAVRSCQNWAFSSASVCIFYDAGNLSKFRVSFIDFGRVKQVFVGKYDEDTTTGIQNLIYFLSEVRENVQLYQNQLRPKSSIVVPEEKIQKYKRLREQHNKSKKTNDI